MALENATINELKEKRVNLLLLLGEEVHGAVRKGEAGISSKGAMLSRQIQDIDIHMNKLTNPTDNTGCPQCHGAIDEGTVFCKMCGYGVQEHFKAYVSKCARCNEPMKEEQGFCSICGTPNGSVTTTKNDEK